MAELSETVLCCEICSEDFDDKIHIPRVLPCFHAFCGVCLEKLHRDGSLSCPNCRRETPVQGVFPVDMTRMAILDLKRSVQSQGGVSCQGCSEGARATSRCQDCAEFLCEDCSAAHRRVKLSKDHTVVSLSEAAKSPEKFLQTSEKCERHADEKVKLFCVTCSKAVCAICALTMHKKCEELVELDSVLDKKKKEAKNRFILIIREAFVSRFVEDVESQADRAKILSGVFREYLEELSELKDRYVSSYSQVELGEVNSEAFPPCMKAIIAKIQQGINVSHEARFSLVAFLHRIGMKNEDILNIFATVPDFRKDLTLYQIRHITGEISGKEYSVPKCATMRSFGLCIRDVAKDDLCNKKWMTHPLLYYKIKKEALAKKGTSRRSKSAEEQ